MFKKFNRQIDGGNNYIDDKQKKWKFRRYNIPDYFYDKLKEEKTEVEKMIQKWN